MPLVVALAVLVAGGVVAAAVLVDSDDGNGDGGRSSPAPADLEIGELEPALLTEDDLGSEFSASADEGDDDEPFDTDAADTSEDCRDALERFESTDDSETENLNVEFERASDNVSIQHELALIQPDEPTLDDVADGLGRCDRIAYEDEGQQVEMRMGVDEVDGLGDQALGVEITIDVSVVTVEMYGVIVVRDGVTSSVVVTGPFDRSSFESGPADRELARDLAATADERVQDVLEG